MSMEKECNVKHTEYSDSFYGEYEPFLHNAGAFIIRKIEELLIKKMFIKKLRWHHIGYHDAKKRWYRSITGT